MRKVIILTVLLISATQILISQSAGEDRLQYIDKFKRIAVREMERTGIPASIKLAQAILESDGGRSYLARKGNNHFGIKCGNDWSGRKVYREDDDYDENGRKIKSCFRRFRNAEDSYIAHSEFLRDPKKSQRYGFLFLIDPSDYRRWAYGLMRSGYATSPNYHQKLIDIIESYQLYQYDREAPGDIIPVDELLSGVQYINDVKYLVAETGDTPQDIANRTGTALRSVLKFNEKLFAADQDVPANTRVFLQQKRKSFRGRDKWHYVREGESMFDISQEYGVRLDKLYKRNRMSEGMEPMAGERIAIRGSGPQPRLRSQATPTRPVITEPDDEIEMEPVPPPRPVVPPTTPTTPPPSNPSNNGSTPTTPSQPPVYVPSNPPTTSGQYHTVSPGDTLYNIARRYSLSVDQLKKLNNLSADVIKIGQQLRVQ